MPVATNCSLLSYAISGKPSCDVTWMEVRPPIVTVIITFPVTPSIAALIMLFPVPTAVTNPVGLMVATLGVSLVQDARDETSFCDPSLDVPVAHICTVLAV
jgi:hypothetical protein